MKLLAIYLVLFFRFTSIADAKCVHEIQMTGAHIKSLDSSEYFVEVDGRFIRADKLNNKTKNTFNDHDFYNVQLNHKADLEGDYNQTYLKYYDFAQMNLFLSQEQTTFDRFGYKIEIIGKSLEGRNLFAVVPKNISATKKTIVMYGRHHGDEGTANWIIEGFIRKLFAENNSQWFEDYQILLYPMVNPDGAEARSRYNKNGRDLNRSWALHASGEFDEIVTIHNHLRVNWNSFYKNIFIMLDMHGSFDNDFIYRVDNRFRGADFYSIQQTFIDELSRYDQWQAGNFELSNGEPGMSRIVMVKNFGINALTHETPRDIRINNNQGRSLQSLNQQGEAILTSIKNLY